MEVKPKFLSRAHLSAVLCTLYSSDNKTFADFEMFITVKSITSFCCYCLSVTQSWLTLCDPMDCSTPGSPVLHYLLELVQTHVHWVSDAIQPSHPPSSPSPSAFYLFYRCQQVMSLLFNMLSGLVIAFLPRSKHLLISWLQSPVILEARKVKSLTVFTVSPSICHKVMGPDAMIFVFLMLSFKPAFSLSCFTLIKRLFSHFLLSAIKVISSAYLRLLIFLPASDFQT